MHQMFLVDGKHLGEYCVVKVIFTKVLEYQSKRHNNLDYPK